MKREIERAVHAALQGLPVELVELAQGRVHCRMTVKYEERMKTFSLSGSPKNLHYLANNIRGDVLRFIRGQYK